MVTTLVAGAVILGGLSGSASANVGPGGVDVGSVSIIGDTTVDPPDVGGDDTTVESLQAMVTGLARECTADDGLCTLALATASDAVTAATACLNAMASEAGVEPAVTAAMAKVGLDCGGVVRLMSGYARFALQTVNDCTSEANAACRIAFDAARLGIDRAAGCLDGVLSSTSDTKTVEGSDPGCASALAMLYREAEGLIALLTGCLNGDADSAACADVHRIGAYARDGLTGCVGDMWVALTDVEPVPYETGGPLACYAVLDQVNVAINGWLGRVPELPATITPTSEEEDCSITVLPPVPHADPQSGDGDTDTSGAQHDAHIFVPSCAEPEWVQGATNVATPPLHTDTDLEGPECENATESERWDITRTTGDIKKKYGHTSVVNVNVETTPFELSTTAKVKYHATITVGGETELKTWIGKINAKFGIEAGLEREHTITKTATPRVPPKTEMHIARLLHAKVVEGRYYKKTSDCRVVNEFRRIKAPYHEKWFIWQEPWNGGPPE